MEQNNKIILFQEKRIRREWHNDKWHFSIVDVIEVLTDSPIPRNYWTKVKKSLLEESQTHPFWMQLKLAATDGKLRLTDCTDTEGVLRLIMSVPSPKAEPFKLWLAQVGRERMDEIENPELGIERIKELYKAKGYSDEWINMRLKSIDIRKELTDEWKGRGVKEGQEYSILTAEISKATFGMSPSEYSKFKNLDKHNLRDHMTNLELIFTMLGEESTRQTAVENNAIGFEENHEAALKGGTITGKALKLYEKESNRKVVSPENFLKQIEEAEKKGQLPDENAQK